MVSWHTNSVTPLCFPLKNIALKIKTARFRFITIFNQPLVDNEHHWLSQGVFVHRQGNVVTFLSTLRGRPITTVPQMEVTFLPCGVHWTVSTTESMFIVVSWTRSRKRNIKSALRCTCRRIPNKSTRAGSPQTCSQGVSGGKAPGTIEIGLFQVFVVMGYPNRFPSIDSIGPALSDGTIFVGHAAIWRQITSLRASASKYGESDSKLENSNFLYNVKKTLLVNNFQKHTLTLGRTRGEGL